MNLVQILACLVIAFLEGSYPIKGLGKVLSQTNRKFAIEQVPELADALRAYDAGDEIDWHGLGDGLIKYAQEYAKQPNAKESWMKIMRIFARYCKTSSESALKEIYKLSSKFEDDFLQGYFVRDHIDQQAVIRELGPLTRRLGGKGIGLTQDEAKDAKQKNPELYKEYLDARRRYNDAWKIAIDSFVRQTGDNTVPILDALKYLKTEGIEHNMPTGFTGRIDSHCKWYTNDGQEILGAPPSAVMFPSVKMNPAYSAESPWVFQAVRFDGTMGNYFYTAGFRKAQSDQKFQNVAKFDVEAVRKKWLPLLRKFNPDKPDMASVGACILEILYRTSNRVGTFGKPNGISTLWIANYYPQTDGSVKFIYLGKDDVKTVALIKKSDDLVAKQVCDIVNALAEGKKPKDLLFTAGMRGNKYIPVGPAAVNKLFRACTGGLDGLTVHKLRTAKGSSLYREYLTDLFAKKKTLTPDQVKQAWLKGGEIVGKELNHVRRSAEGTQKIQPSTSLKNYIDPTLQVELFSHYGAPLPPALEKLVSDESVLASSGEFDEGYLC